jgi:arylsulfatase A
MVGETLDLLKDVASNTLLIFSSDNGAPNRYEKQLDSTGPLRGQKTTMYEGGLRVPFIASWQGRIKPGSTTDAPVYFPDLMPTFAEVADAKPHVPKNIDGVSITPELFGTGKLDRNRPLYWEWNRGHMDKEYVATRQALRRGQWKLLREDPAKPWELYDLQADPAEATNVAASHASMVKEMEAWIAANRTDPPPQVEPTKPAGQRWR